MQMSPVLADDISHRLDQVAVAADRVLEGEARPDGRHLRRQAVVERGFLVDSGNTQPGELGWTDHHVSQDAQEESL